MKYLIFLLFFVFLVGCNASTTEETDVQTIANNFLKQQELDKRMNLLRVSLTHDTLSGFAQSKVLANDFISYLNQEISTDNFVNEIKIIDTSKVAYIANSVSNARTEGKHSAELSTQYLLGQKLTVIDKKGGWYFIQGPDRYLAWIDAGGLATGDEISDEYLQAEKIMVQSNQAIGYNPEETSSPAMDLVFGNRLGKLQNNLYVLPDGRKILVKDKSIFTPPTETDKIQLVLAKANSLMGRPYLWGGTSTKGMDCSGFTRTAFMNAGYLLSRDASLQVNEGQEIDKDNISAWQPGDLLFFGTYRDDGSMRVTHVAIHEQNGQYINSAQRIEEGSLNPEHENYNKKRAESLLAVRRIF